MAKSLATPVLSSYDASFNAGIDHGAGLGAQSKVVAVATAQGLKRGGASVAGYSHGFAKGFVHGWKCTK